MKTVTTDVELSLLACQGRFVCFNYIEFVNDKSAHKKIHNIF